MVGLLHRPSRHLYGQYLLEAGLVFVESRTKKESFIDRSVQYG